MSITFDPQALLYAVVEYLKSTKHIYDPVEHKPERDGQFRLVCLAPNADQYSVGHSDETCLAQRIFKTF